MTNIGDYDSTVGVEKLMIFEIACYKTVCACSYGIP